MIWMEEKEKIIAGFIIKQSKQCYTSYCSLCNYVLWLNMHVRDMKLNIMHITCNIMKSVYVEVIF